MRDMEAQSRSLNTVIQSNRGAALEGSRKFMIDQREFTFDEHDQIFSMTQPTAQKVNTPSCNTCGAKWEKTSHLKDAHCQFCGISNCKVCLRKTRFFMAAHDGSEEQSKRGKCCKLCDRKFHIREMVMDKLKLIATRNTQIDEIMLQQKKEQHDMAASAIVNRQQADQDKKRLEEAKKDLEDL